MRLSVLFLLLSAVCFVMPARDVEFSEIFDVGSPAVSVSVSYRGKKGDVSRTMYYDENGVRLMHIGAYYGGCDTAVFDAQGRYMAKIDRRGLVYIQDGTTKYDDYVTAYEIENVSSVAVDDSSVDSEGNWQQATTSSRFSPVVTRAVAYQPTPETAALVEYAKARRSEFAEAFDARLVNHSSNEMSGKLFFAFMDVVTFVLLLLVWLFTRSSTPKYKYALRTVFAWPFFCMIIMSVVLGAVITPTLTGTLIPFVVLVGLGLIWIPVGKRFFRTMGYCRELGNTYIVIVELAWSIPVTLICIVPLCSLLIPLPIVNVLAGLAAGLLLWNYQDATKDRCPRCHSMDAFHYTHRTKAGLQTEVSKDRDSSTSLPTEVMPGVFERTTVDKKTTTTDVYQLWRKYYRCRVCGYQSSRRVKGDRVSSQRSVDTETMSERTNVNG